MDLETKDAIKNLEIAIKELGNIQDKHFTYIKEIRKRLEELETWSKYEHQNLVDACGRIEKGRRS